MSARTEHGQYGVATRWAVLALVLSGCAPEFAPSDGGPAPDAAASAPPTVDAGAPAARDAATPDASTVDPSALDAGAPPADGSTASGVAAACERSCTQFEACGSTRPWPQCVEECARGYAPLTELGCAAATETLIDCLGEAVSRECRTLAILDACPVEKAAMRGCREDVCRVDPTVAACGALCREYCAASPRGLACEALCGGELADAHRSGCGAPAWDWAICRALGLAETVDGIRCYTVSVELEGCLSRAR
ncbi:MAG: hypothetical protein RLP09_20420 [Sandaracinaceae bacterium]